MHPLSRIEQPDRPMWIVILTILAVVVFVVLQFPERAMRRTGGIGIVPFELAEDKREVRRIFATWGPAGKRAARISLNVDYAFLLAYAALLAIANLYLAERADVRNVGGVAAAAAIAAWAALIAGLLDAVENTALLVVLRAPPDSNVLIVLAHWSARIKFALVGLCILTLLLGTGLVAVAPAETGAF